MADYETLRQQHVQLWGELQPQYIERIRWPAERLRAEREQRLRELIRVAKERSPWHRARLAHIDADRVTEADLPSIPPMTKQDMMENFDEVLTDRRLTRDAVEAHLEGLSEDAYLLDEFHAVASGGSSGTRGVFVYGWDAWAIANLTFVRFRRRMMQADPEIGIDAPAVMIAAGKATHMTYAMGRTFGRSANVTAVPATLPLPEIVSRLNDIQPVVMNGYPTMLYALAKEASAGRLRVRPRIIGPGSEPLLPEMRLAMEEAWGCPILNVLGTSEGVAAVGCGESRGMHLADDAAIFEIVDSGGQPVAPGVRGAKMYITNLYNHVQPLIRYELTDEADAHRRALPVRLGRCSASMTSRDAPMMSSRMQGRSSCIRSCSAPGSGTNATSSSTRCGRRSTGPTSTCGCSVPLTPRRLPTLLERDLARAGVRTPKRHATGGRDAGPSANGQAQALRACRRSVVSQLGERVTTLRTS